MSDETAVPVEIQRRLDGWYKTFWGFLICHYLFGIGGVLAATLAAVMDEPYSKAAGVVAAVCMAVIGFVQPDRQYRKYVIAWRLLDEKVNLFRYGLLNMQELLHAMADAERALDQIEREVSKGPVLSHTPITSAATPNPAMERTVSDRPQSAAHVE